MLTEKKYFRFNSNNCPFGLIINGKTFENYYYLIITSKTKQAKNYSSKNRDYI